MLRTLLALAVLGAAAPAAPLAALPTPASLGSSSTARQLFERDWVLMGWALKFFDRDHDILLSQSEGEAAAKQFRALADADSDGRVTPQEYRAARAFILARY